MPHRPRKTRSTNPHADCSRLSWNWGMPTRRHWPPCSTQDSVAEFPVAKIPSNSGQVLDLPPYQHLRSERHQSCSCTKHPVVYQASLQSKLYGQVENRCPVRCGLSRSTTPPTHHQHAIKPPSHQRPTTPPTEQSFFVQSEGPIQPTPSEFS